MAKAAWPELPYTAWKDTYATLHLWTQIAGKIRLARTLGSIIPGTWCFMCRRGG